MFSVFINKIFLNYGLVLKNSYEKVIVLEAPLFDDTYGIYYTATIQIYKL